MADESQQAEDQQEKQEAAKDTQTNASTPRQTVISTVIAVPIVLAIVVALWVIFGGEIREYLKARSSTNEIGSVPLTTRSLRADEEPLLQRLPVAVATFLKQATGGPGAMRTARAEIKSSLDGRDVALTFGVAPGREAGQFELGFPAELEGLADEGLKVLTRSVDFQGPPDFEPEGTRLLLTGKASVTWSEEGEKEPEGVSYSLIVAAGNVGGGQVGNVVLTIYILDGTWSLLDS